MGAQPTIQTSFASGEWAPKLRSRVDVQKYRLGAALLRNFYVDYSGGGASTRPGTRYLGQVGAPGARLIPFQPSSSVSYVLEFGNGYIRFFSNGAQVMSGGNPYQIASPYAASDLFSNPVTGNPGLKFVQDVTSLIICHPSYPPQILTIKSPTNWTIQSINFGATIKTPTGATLTTTLPVLASGWNYSYIVTAVDVDGQESIPTSPVTISGYQALNTNAGTNLVSWTAVSGAVSYNVYKASPTYTTAIQLGTPYGFIGNTTGTSFADAMPGIAPDFSQTAPVGENPFMGAGVQSYTVTAAGTYTTVPNVTVAAPPAGGIQATAQAVLGIITIGINAGGSGYTAGQIYNIGPGIGSGGPSVVATGLVNSVDGSGGILSISIVWAGSLTSGAVPTNPLGVMGGGNNATVNVTWGVIAVNVIQPGAGYTSAPAVTFSAGAAAATAVLFSAAGGNPSVPGFVQERLCLANQPQSVQGFNFSQPGNYFDFNTTFPEQPDDAISGSIVGEDLNDIRSLISVPTGLLALTGKAAWLLNGGGGISTMVPLTPTNIVAQPQAFNGANDLKPIKVNMDVLYVTNKGNYVRDLVYNLYMQIFTGMDITTISNHLFFGYNLVDWAWSEEPFKTLWAVRSDGILLSLGFVKEQDLMGWAHHDTNGQFKSVASVIEVGAGGGPNTIDAVYVIVERVLNGTRVQTVERMADRFFYYGYEDSWCVDCALQTAPSSSPPGLLTITGNASIPEGPVTLIDTADAPFTAAMATNGYVVRAGGGIYLITQFISASQVQATVVRTPTLINPYNNTAYPVVGFAIWTPITSVSGLTHLANMAVTGVADGTVINGTVSAGGTLALGGTYTKVTLGLAYTPDLQTLPLDLGEPTVQSKRKKLPAATLRVADTLGLSIGTSFANVVPMKDFTIGNIGTQSNALVTDLTSGDGRTILDQLWQEPGQLSIRQTQPYPATILAVIPEVVVGDTSDQRSR